MESSAHVERNVSNAAAKAGHLQSRNGWIRGRRSLKQAKTYGDGHPESSGNKKKMEADEGEGSLAVPIKKGRGRPRKVCINQCYFCRPCFI